MSAPFKSYDPEQMLLFPPSLREWLPAEHLAYFILDVVETLDLSEVYAYYDFNVETNEKGEVVAKRPKTDRGRPAYDPRMMTALLLYASKHKAMSYERMLETEKKLQEEIAKLLAKAQTVDAAEDELYGKGRRGNELPAELARRETRLAKIREAKAALEQEAKERAAQEAEVARAKIEERRRKEEETGKKIGGHPPEIPDSEKAVPEPKAQRNFTDAESRIMKDGATKGFEQAYNAQAAVDGEAQVIVAAAVTQQANDKQQLTPMLKRVEENVGRLPEKVSADAGYFSETNVTDPTLRGTDLHVPPDRQKHGQVAEEASGPAPPGAGVIDQMRHKLKTAAGRAVYKMRKQIVEPVFGQIKEARGFRRFSFRGLWKVTAEWTLICLTHNLLKLFRSKKLVLARV